MDERGTVGAPFVIISATAKPRAATMLQTLVDLSGLGAFPRFAGQFTRQFSGP